MQKFKNYLKTQSIILESHINNLKKEIDFVKSPSNIDIKKYGRIEDLIKAYQDEKNIKYLGRLIKPSRKKLIEFIQKRETKRIEEELSNLKDKLKSVNELVVWLESGEKSIIMDSTSAIKEILEYATVTSEFSMETIKKIIEVCYSTKLTDSVPDKIKINIKNYFALDGSLLKEIDSETINMFFGKLFIIILNKKEQEKYSLVINQILTELTLMASNTKPETRKKLEEKKEALITLKEHIKGSTIVKTIELSQFSEILSKAGIEDKIKEILLQRMVTRVSEEEQNKENNILRQTIQTYLSESEQRILREAADEINKTIGPMRDLLSRAKNDVISLCKYLSYFGESANNLDESLGILQDRMNILKHVLNNVRKENKEPNTLFYLTGKDGVPSILRSLEQYDATEYGAIYDLLYGLSINAEGKKIYYADGIEFKVLKKAGIKLIYTIHCGNNIVIDIEKRNRTTDIKRQITEETTNKIREISTCSHIPAFRDIHSTYEQVLLNALNIQEQPYTMTLRKKETKKS